MSDTVTLSLSELRSLVTKAARGAGLSWGLAEEAGWAAEWLARRGLPAADWAALWLADRLAGGPDPISAGVALADRLAGGPVPDGAPLPDGLAAPGYLLPFLHRITPEAACMRLTSAQGEVAEVGAEGRVSFGPGWQARTAGWRLSLHPGTLAQAAGFAARLALSRSVLDGLEALALQTTVPPSASSRRDAGAAMLDND
ncbi:DUF3726 domain-containing protein [Tabrizicola oligotrophica]|uniref:DUF3726 domain-containing protein n=1 Tax=Tabrizicola oligotrophica TaxID=2710650 RepID=A0A6M0QXB2_9RHOB|nr:DUF3726 domain-containing protein [Tabrizicola oligotrophica]NEY91333.1 DUF3726 domain-containing protein [Tabrizicola oligotrophica]